MAGLWTDIVYGVRVQRRTPLVSGALIAILAVTIAATTVAFSLIDRLFLAAPPVRDPERLTRIYTSFAGGPEHFTLSYPDFEDLRALDTIFSGVVAEAPVAVRLAVSGGSERIWGEAVSADYFSVLGVTPAAGRFFTAGAEWRTEGESAVVISDALWRRAFGSSPDVFSKRPLLNGRPVRVVGIAPRRFRGMIAGVQPELWRPILRTHGEGRGSREYFALARLQPGVTVEEARTAVSSLARRLQDAYPDTNRGVRFAVVSEAEGRVHPAARGGALRLSAALIGVSVILLLLACANVSAILLVRAAARRREIGIRLALGAARSRIFGQLLAESGVLAVAAGGAGLGLTWAAARTVSAVRLPMRVPLALDVPVNEHVLAFSLVVTFGATLLSGLAPAIDASRTDLLSLVKRADAAGRRAWRLRASLLGAQVALALVLLVGGALFTRSLHNAARVDLGFDPANVVTTSVDPGLQGYADDETRTWLRRVIDRIAALPSTDAVSVTSSVPFEFNITTVAIAPGGPRPRQDEGFPQIDYAAIGSRYFATMKTPVLDGREFDERDTAASRRVVIINDALARRFWPGASAVGQRLALRDDGDVEVVGVVRTARHVTLGETPRPFVYFPLAQRGGAAMTLLVRATGDAAPRLREITAIVHSIDPALPVYNVTTLEDRVALARLPATTAAAVLGAVALAALVLTFLGLYGSIAEICVRRAHEIGIRRALGANDADVARLVAGPPARLVLAGAAAGVPLAAAASRVVGSVLYGVAWNDAVAFASASAVLILVAACAAAGPAWRAIRMNPGEALRCE
jgi:predicted permease